LAATTAHAPCQYGRYEFYAYFQLNKFKSLAQLLGSADEMIE
jgi:hypothetical protein